MSLSFPLSLPSVRGLMGVTLRRRSIVGESDSPFDGSQQVYVHQGAWWEGEASLPPMSRADAADWIACLTSLNGMEGTFYMGPDPVSGVAPRGSWAGSPLVNGAHAVGVTSIAMDGFSSGATGKNYDWIQFGSGSSRTLHIVVKDFAANGSGVVASMEIWPRLKIALADNAAIVTSNPMGVFRLTSNDQEWTVQKAQKYGLHFAFKEAF
jgi:hypothetical protein